MNFSNKKLTKVINDCMKEFDSVKEKTLCILNLQGKDIKLQDVQKIHKILIREIERGYEYLIVERALLETELYDYIRDYKTKNLHLKIICVLGCDCEGVEEKNYKENFSLVNVFWTDGCNGKEKSMETKIAYMLNNSSTCLLLFNEFTKCVGSVIKIAENKGIKIV